METVEELLKPTQTLYLDVMCYANMINQQYGECLKPPRPGLYKVGEITPCMVPGVMYYFSKAFLKSDYVNTENFLSFPNLQGTLYDENAIPVLSPYIVANRGKYIKPYPTVPVAAYNIVRWLISMYLETVMRPPCRPYASGEVYNNILPQYYGLFTDGILEKICEPLFYQISNFMGNNIWHIYTVKQLITTIMVEKTNDYRIIEYHRRIENGDFTK